MASGSGNSKKQAKHAAARAMLDMLDGKEGSIYPGSASSVTTSPTGPVSIAVAAQVPCVHIRDSGMLKIWLDRWILFCCHFLKVAKVSHKYCSHQKLKSVQNITPFTLRESLQRI